MPMKKSHRYFLQSFMSKGILQPREVRKLHRLACERCEGTDAYSEEGLVEFVSTINANIKPVHLEIRKAVCEDTGAHCYGLVNTRESDIMKLASDYTINDLEFFKKIVENVVESEEGSITSIDALNLVEQLEKKMTRKDAQDLLLKMMQDLWLSKNQNGSYVLSPRSILELEQYMLEQYPDSTVKCNMCKRICIQGQCCTGADCEVKMHNHCAVRFFDKKTNKICPRAGCDTPWPYDLIKTGDAATGSDEPATQQTSRKRTSAKSS